MNIVRQRRVLELRLVLLRDYIERVGSSPGFERELKTVEAELQRLGQRTGNG